MFHFLAKLGQKPWTKQATAVICASIPATYMGVHCYAHNIIRNLLVADDGYGDKSHISDKLQSLIISVNEDIKDLFNQSILPQNLNRDTPPTPIKWFASCTLMPSTFGLTLSKSGVIIGIPNYFNYDKAEDLPDNMFFVKNVKFLKAKKDKEGGANDRPDGSALSGLEKEAETVSLLDRNDPEVVNYVDALILSEKAKKFVIARELFISDSFRVLANAGIMLFSGLLALMLSRASVKILKLTDAHVSQRIPAYLIAGFFGYQNFNFVSDSANREYILAADKKAATLNTDYMEGAKEFFEKTIQRNKALRGLVDEFQSVYDERGNVKQPLIRFKYVPLEERLKLIRREQAQVRESSSGWSK